MLTSRIGKLGAACVVLMMLGTAAFAQTPKTPKAQKGKGRAVSLAALPVETLDSLLKLTADQKSKFTVIHDKFEAEAKSLRPAKGAPADPTNRRRLGAITQQANADVEALLTAEQKSRLQAMRKDLGLFQSARVPVALVGELKLSPDQKEKMEALAREMQEKSRGIDPTQRRALRQEYQAKMEALLTAEQRATVGKYQREHKKGKKTG